MSINGINAFGNFASIQRQAEEIKKRVKSQTDARESEQSKTGLIKNPDTGEKVEMSTLTEDQIAEWNRRNELNTISMRDAYVLFSAADPHAEEIEENKKLAARFEKIQNKMLSGQKLKSEEKKFLREHYPDLAAKADQMEVEAENLKKKLQGRSGDDARRIYMEAKLNAASELDPKDGSAIFLMAAIDKAFEEHNSKSRIDIRA